jgi:hypothetical protein
MPRITTTVMACASPAWCRIRTWTAHISTPRISHITSTFICSRPLTGPGARRSTDEQQCVEPLAHRHRLVVLSGCGQRDVERRGRRSSR